MSVCGRLGPNGVNAIKIAEMKEAEKEPENVSVLAMKQKKKQIAGQRIEASPMRLLQMRTLLPALLAPLIDRQNGAFGENGHQINLDAQTRKER